MSTIVNQVQVTKEGLEELQAELIRLRDVEMPKVIQRVAAARAHGDLSENAEYSNAKEEQQLMETRISEVEDILQRAVIVKQTKNTNKIGVGSTVVVSIKKNPKKLIINLIDQCLNFSYFCLIKVKNDAKNN